MVTSFAVYQATVLPAIFVLGPAIADADLGGAGAWALILSCRSVGGLLGGAALLRWRPRRPMVASSLLMLLDAPFLIALATGGPLWLCAATSVLSAAALVASDTLWETTLQERVPQQALSRVSAYDWLGSLAINPIGFSLIGVVAAAAGRDADRNRGHCRRRGGAADARCPAKHPAGPK